MTKQLRHEAYRSKTRNNIRPMVLASQRHHTKTQLDNRLRSPRYKMAKINSQQPTKQKAGKKPAFSIPLLSDS
jgi:hypothetical protein